MRDSTGDIPVTCAEDGCSTSTRSQITDGSLAENIQSRLLLKRVCSLPLNCGKISHSQVVFKSNLSTCCADIAFEAAKSLILKLNLFCTQLWFKNDRNVLAFWFDNLLLETWAEHFWIYCGKGKIFWVLHVQSLIFIFVYFDLFFHYRQAFEYGWQLGIDIQRSTIRDQSAGTPSSNQPLACLLRHRCWRNSRWFCQDWRKALSQKPGMFSHNNEKCERSFQYLHNT